MAASYDRLFKLLIERGMKKKDLKAVTGLSYSTITKLENGNNVTVEVLERICLKLNCSIGDVIEIVPDGN